MTERLTNLKKEYHDALQGLNETLLSRLIARLATHKAISSTPERVKVEARVTTTDRILESKKTNLVVETKDNTSGQGHTRWNLLVFLATIVTVLSIFAILAWNFREHPQISPYLEPVIKTWLQVANIVSNNQ